MTTTTPTPAPAKLDLDRLEALARAAEPWSFGKEVAEFKSAVTPAAVLVLIDLARRAAQPVAPVQAWTPVTKQGQVRVGDKLRFTIGDKSYSQRAKLILHAGMEDEEVIYDKGRNFYFITKCVMSGFSNHKNVEVLQTVATPSPQIAEVASIDTNDFRDLITELHAAHEEVGRESSKKAWAALVQHINSHTRDAIAASRRAALDVIVPSFDCSLAAVDAYDPQSLINGAKWAQDKFLAAPASAGQAAPAEIYNAALLAVERMRGFAATIIEDHAKDTYPGHVGCRPQDVATMWAKKIHDIDAKAFLDEAIADQAAQPAEGAGQVIPGKNALFAVNILGGPMREYAPGQWESAVWPSEGAGQAGQVAK